MAVDKKFIVNLKGREFVKYEGLLDTAHKMGLLGIKTELVKLDNNQAIFRAEAFTSEGCFTGYGDADPKNVNTMIGPHIIRMAETRAKARALRDLTNIGMTAVEELGGDDVVAPETKKTSRPRVKRSFAERLRATMDEAGLTEETAQTAFVQMFGEDRKLQDLDQDEREQFLDHLAKLIKEEKAN